FSEIEPSEIDAMIDVNLKAPMHLTLAFLPAMVERKRGHLIYIGSSGGQAPYPNMAAYGPSNEPRSREGRNADCRKTG
ncbi:SDR family oxidoreductase, partial [Rhizobium leguminosarum]|uniref:SDR family oxidoreductase n=1 Tax=Rhizobium leguminosarum TaxID=384 RepID=UPI003F981C8D